MPITRIQKLGKESAWALWHINEPEEELSYDALESAPEEVVSSQKRLEFLAGRALIKELVTQAGLEYNGLRKDDFGKPFLKNLSHQISLSHSYPYVAAQLSASLSVGIDVEQPKEKLLKIAPRVLSLIEQKDAGTNLAKHCVYWCAKEAMYKIHGKRGLHFNSQLNIEPFTLGDQGILQGTISTDTLVHVELGYQVEDDFVMVYTRV